MDKIDSCYFHLLRLLLYISVLQVRTFNSHMIDNGLRKEEGPSTTLPASHKP